MTNIELITQKKKVEFLEAEDDNIGADRDIYWSTYRRLFGTIQDWLEEDDQESIQIINLTADMRVADMKKYLREVTLVKLHEKGVSILDEGVEAAPLETLIKLYCSTLSESKKELKMDSYSLLFLDVEASFLNTSGACLWGDDPDEIGVYPVIYKREDGSWDKVVSWIGADPCQRALWLLGELENRAAEVDQNNLSAKEPVLQFCKKTSKS